ncbi:hypothetical protein NEUTE2DRAFT_37003, partial [Neurospora tetrasperma FGSC 2509]
MRQRLRSSFQTHFKRHENTEDRESSKDQEQSRPASLLEVPTSTQHIPATPSTSSLPFTAALAIGSTDVETSASKLPLAPATGSINIKTSTPRPPATPATGSADRETSAGADDTTTSLPARLWERAYNELKQEEVKLVDAYEKILSRQLQNGSNSMVLESQPNIIAQSNSDRRRQMTQLINAGLAKTEREAKVKESCGEVVDVVLSVKNIIFINPIKATKANREGIDYVVKRMKWYWSLSNSLLKDPTNNISELSGIRGELEIQIVDLYKALLSYQIKSVCAYYRHRGLIFLRDMIRLDDWKADLGAIREAENCFQNDDQTYNNHAQTYNNQQLASDVKQLVSYAMSEKDQKCLEHLRLTDPRDDKVRIEQTKGGLLQDSYRWVLDNADFQQWRDHLQHRLLWIKGDPGKGKTMLLCGIINELDQGNARHCNVAYFFCQATDSRINNATAILRGLIYLLIEQQPSVLSHVRKEYDRAGENLFKDANTWIALSRIFTNILRDPSLRTTYLVIDALDECVTTDLPQLLDFIAQQSSSGSRVKWIVSSRNWPQIEERLKKAADKVKVSLELNAESVAAAVNAFILQKVDYLKELKEYDPITKKTVQDYLCSNAQDTFLWVALVCQALEKVQKAFAVEKLRMFPSGLDALYARMREDMSQFDESDYCKHILAVVAIVRRPISLQELASLAELPNTICNNLEFLKDIIGLCEAFDWIFPKGKEDVHYIIFLRLLDAMSTTLRRDIYGLRAPGFPNDKVQVPNPDPLATVRYSCVYWVDHLRDSVSGTNTKRHDPLQDNVVYTFLKTKYLYWLEALNLLQAMPAGVVAIRKLEGLLLSKLVWDAYRFTLSYKSIIEQAPLQVYISALIFAPSGSLIKKNFRAEEPEWIRTKPAVELDWNACLQTLEGHSDSVHSVAFSPDGQRLASGSLDKTVKIWDPASGSCLQTLKGHSDWVRSVAFSPDGQRVASGSDDKTVKIWDPASGSCLQTLEGHSDSIFSVAFSPDGQRVASGSDDKTVKIWDPASGSCLQTLEGHSDSIFS